MVKLVDYHRQLEVIYHVIYLMCLRFPSFFTYFFFSKVIKSFLPGWSSWLSSLQPIAVQTELDLLPSATRIPYCPKEKEKKILGKNTSGDKICIVLELHMNAPEPCWTELQCLLRAMSPFLHIFCKHDYFICMTFYPVCNQKISVQDSGAAVLLMQWQSRIHSWCAATRIIHFLITTTE